MARKIKTSSLEDALDQIIRVQTSGGKASIRPAFVAGVLKELIDRRKEDEVIFAEVEEIFGAELAAGTRLVVDEVKSLSQLGTSSFDLEKAEWRLPKETEPSPELDESDVTYEVPHKPVLRTKHSSSSVMVHGRWEDGSSTRKLIIYVLLTVILLTFGSLMLV
jgi:hypothetical protein